MDDILARFSLITPLCNILFIQKIQWLFHPKSLPTDKYHFQRASLQVSQVPNIRITANFLPIPCFSKHSSSSRKRKRIEAPEVLVFQTFSLSYSMQEYEFIKTEEVNCGIYGRTPINFGAYQEVLILRRISSQLSLLCP